MNDYIEELDFGDSKAVEKFWEQIDKRIKKIIKEEVKCDKTYYATVMDVGAGVASIKLQGGTNTITNVKNKTGVTLNVNDEVLIEAINGSLNNLVIKYKK